MKEYRLNVRISNEELDALDNAISKNNMSRSEYVREILDNSFGYKPKERYVLEKQLINEVNHIGNNINQITRNNNSELYFESDKKKLFNLMNELLELVRKRLGNGSV